MDAKVLINLPTYHSVKRNFSMKIVILYSTNKDSKLILHANPATLSHLLQQEFESSGDLFDQVFLTKTNSRHIF